MGVVLLLWSDSTDHVKVLRLLRLVAWSAALVSVVFEGFELHAELVVALLEDAVGLFEGS